MRLALEIVARDLELPPPVHLEIEKRASKLDRFYDRIMRCRVTVEGPGRHHRRGFFTLRLDITVPGGELVINRQSGENLLEAIKEAFSAAERRIEDHIRRSRRQVKAHDGPPRARVSALFPEEGYGFLETPDGREIYFHRNSVVDGNFGDLKPGTLVWYAEKMGEEGPQASTVKVMKRGLPASRRANPSMAEIPGDRKLPGTAPRGSPPPKPKGEAAGRPRSKDPSMFRKILVPLDGSLTSEAILPYVRHYFPGSEVLLLRTPEGSLPGLSAAQSADEVKHYLHLTRERLTREGFDVGVLPASGLPAEAILEAAREERPDLIAMTTRGRTGGAGPLLGSVAEVVVRASLVPVLAVRPFWLQESLPAPAPEPRAPKGILVPLNGSDATLGIQSYVLALATSWGAQVVLLRVNPEGSAVGPKGRELLAGIQDELETAGIPVESILDHGDPLARILEASRARDIDLIAMATHTGPPESRFDDRSLTGRILRNARVPVFAVRAETPAPGTPAVPVSGREEAASPEEGNPRREASQDKRAPRSPRKAPSRTRSRGKPGARTRGGSRKNPRAVRQSNRPKRRRSKA